MKAFLLSEEWKELNVGFALDEGLANPIDEYTVFFGERMPWCKFRSFFFFSNESNAIHSSFRLL